MEAHSLHPDAQAVQAVEAGDPAKGPSWLSPIQRAQLLQGAVAGLLVLLIAFFVDRTAAYASILLGGQFALGLALGGILFIVLGHITGAGWSVVIRRVAEAMYGALPFAAGYVLVSVIVSLGAYEWSHAEVVAEDALLVHKSVWLNPTGVILRAVLFLGLWMLFARIMRRMSLRQDAEGAQASKRVVMVSCLFMVTFALTFSMASFDWLMSLEAHWYSTVYAIYNFTSVLVSGLAMLTILVIWLRRRGPLAGILKPAHLHDLGKLLLGFTTFWAYIWFCQYMLIWYSDIPEETVYYVGRLDATWAPWSGMNVVINWVVPFLLLLPAAAKRSEKLMMRVAILLLVGRVLDLHLLIAPAITDNPWTILWSVGSVATAICGFMWFADRSLSQAPLIPRNEPFLDESLHHHG